MVILWPKVDFVSMSFKIVVIILRLAHIFLQCIVMFSAHIFLSMYSEFQVEWLFWGPKVISFYVLVCIIFCMACSSLSGFFFFFLGTKIICFSNRVCQGSYDAALI